MVYSLRPLVVCGPSGSGKSSLLRLLFEEFPEKFGFSVSHTTRSPRAGEIDGKHYHFTTKEKMAAAIERGEFIENAVFSNNMYGTSKAAVATVQAAGKVCVLDIEVEGVKQVKQTNLNPLFVFVKPPSLEELENRLRNRNTETEESLQRRLAAARSELAYADIPDNFHLVLINDNLEKAYARFRDFIVHEIKKSQETPAVAAHFCCCLGPTSTDRTSDDYYYMSTNHSHYVASYASDGVQDFKNFPESNIGTSFDDGGPSDSSRACDSGWGADSGGGTDSSGACNFGGGTESSGACNSGGGFDSIGASGGSFD